MAEPFLLLIPGSAANSNIIDIVSADFLPGRNYFCLMYMSYKQGGSTIKSAQTRKIFSNTKPRKGEDYWIWFDNFFILSCIDYYHTMVFLFFILFFYFLGYTELFLIQIVKRKINFWWTAEAAVHRCSIKMHFWLDLKFFEKKKEVLATLFSYQWKKRGSDNGVLLSEAAVRRCS